MRTHDKGETRAKRLLSGTNGTPGSGNSMMEREGQMSVVPQGLEAGRIPRPDDRPNIGRYRLVVRQ